MREIPIWRRGEEVGEEEEVKERERKRVKGKGRERGPFSQAQLGRCGESPQAPDHLSDFSFFLSFISWLTLSLSPNKTQIYGDQGCHQPFITVSFPSVSSNSVWGHFTVPTTLGRGAVYSHQQVPGMTALTQAKTQA